jgi:hypothetical protein
MLAGLAVEFGLIADRATGALQVEIGAFTAGQFGLGSEVTCHEVSFKIDLTRPARMARRASLAISCRRSDGGLMEKGRLVAEHFGKATHSSAEGRRLDALGKTSNYSAPRDPRLALQTLRLRCAGAFAGGSRCAESA